MMGVGPKAVRYDAREPILHRPHGRARREAQPIGHAKDMGVDRDHGFTKGGIQDDVGGLAAHARQGLEGGTRAGHLPCVVADQDLARLADMAGLGVVKADAADEGLQFVFTQTQHGRRVRGRPEERPCGLIDSPVRRLRG